MVENNLVSLGIIIIFIGFILIFLGTILQSKSKTEFSFIGFIGPIPIGVSNSRDILYISLMITILVIVFFLMMLRGLKI